MVSASQRQKEDEYHRASSIVSDLNWIKACNIVCRYCEILKDRAIHIIEARGHPELLKDLMP